MVDSRRCRSSISAAAVAAVVVCCCCCCCVASIVAVFVVVAVVVGLLRSAAYQLLAVGEGESKVKREREQLIRC